MTTDPPPSKSTCGPARALKVVCGFVLLIVGGVLTFPGVPGPGIPILLFGLWLLRDHFTWAKQTFDWIKDRVGRFRRTRSEGRQVATQMVNELPEQEVDEDGTECEYRNYRHDAGDPGTLREVCAVDTVPTFESRPQRRRTDQRL
jgi:hypothetical protein